MFHHGYEMGYGSGYGIAPVFGWILGVLFLAVLVLAVVYLVRELGDGRRRAAGGPRPHPEAPPAGPAGGDDPALRILRERYARGEIDRDEFEQRKRDLS